MKELLYWGVGIVAKIHDKILDLNDIFGLNLSDKMMHFWVLGFIGMCMVFVIYPLFKYLAKRNHEMVIAWIYVFTVMVVITFAIEIGQKISGTGNMEFADIVFGLVGFLAMFFIFCGLRVIYHGILWLIQYIKRRQERKELEQIRRATMEAIEKEAAADRIAQHIRQTMEEFEKETE